MYLVNSCHGRTGFEQSLQRGKMEPRAAEQWYDAWVEDRAQCEWQYVDSVI